jgi:type I restriction enzyme S subunit
VSEAPTIELGEIMPTRAGSVEPARFPDEVFDLYSIPAFDRGEPEVVAGRDIGSAKQVVEPGDVLLSKIVPHIRRSWVVGANRGRRLIASSEWIVFRGARVVSRYLRHVLVGDPFHAQFMSTVSGVGGSLLRARPVHVARIKIPLPPLPEQRRIAEILDKADVLRAKRRAALVQLDTLTQSIFLDMFGDPATNPKGWPVTALKSCVAKIQIGPFGSLLHQEDYVGGGIPLVNPKHIQGGVIEIGRDETVTPEKYQELRVYHLAPGDVVMGRRGEMGRCAIVDAASCPLLCGTGSLFLRPDKTQTTSVFLRAMLSSEAIKARLDRLSLGQTLPNLNSRIVEGLEIPLPPVTVQRDFADRVMRSKALGALQQNSLTWLEALFTALQHRAFQGELARTGIRELTV